MVLECTFKEYSVLVDCVFRVQRLRIGAGWFGLGLSMIFWYGVLKGLRLERVEQYRWDRFEYIFLLDFKIGLLCSQFREKFFWLLGFSWRFCGEQVDQVWIYNCGGGFFQFWFQGQVGVGGVRQRYVFYCFFKWYNYFIVCNLGSKVLIWFY